MARVAIVIALVTGALGAGSLLWLAGEAHYRGCVETAVARYPPLFDPGSPGRGTFGGLNYSPGSPPRSRAAKQASAAIGDCSRLPF